MLAAVAAIEDTAHVQMSKAHTENWRNWLTEEIGKLGLKVTPSVANFVLIHFPTTKGKTSAEADAYLTKRGLVLRGAEQLRPAACAAHDHRHRRGQPPRRRRAS